jgi:hypothetical protein
MRSALVVSLAAVLLTVCGDGFGPIPDAPPLMGSPFLSAEINGQVWAPGTDPGQLGLFFGTHRIAITADHPVENPATVERLQLELETSIPPEPGSYVLDSGPAFATLTTYASGQATALFTTTAHHTGTLMIAEVSSTDRLVTGAFRFEAVSFDGLTLRQVRGAFRLRFP